MGLRDEIRRLFQEILETRQSAREFDRGLLGQGDTPQTLWVAGDAEQRVWFRKNGQASQATKVYCVRVRPVYGMPVVCGVAPEQPGLYQVLSWDREALEFNWGGMSEVARHAEMHIWEAAGGGDDPVMIWTRALMPFRLSPQAAPDLTVRIEGPELYLWDTGWQEWSGGNVNLAAHVPGANLHRYCLVSIDGATSAAQTACSTPVSTAIPISPGGYPQPPSGSIPVGLVHLTGGQTTITEADIVDGRVVVSSAGGSIKPGLHHLIDSTAHDDTAAYGAAPNRGDLMAATAAKVWDELAVGAANTFLKSNGSDPAWVTFVHDHSSAAEGDQNLRQILELEFQDAALLTISGGMITRTQVYHLVAAETGAADDLVQIDGGVEGDLLIIRPDAGDTITVHHDEGGAGDNIWLAGGVDIVLDNDDHLVLLCDGTWWCDLSGGAGGALAVHDHHDAASGGDDLNPETISPQTFLVGPSPCPHDTVGEAVTAAGAPTAANPATILIMGIKTVETGAVTLPHDCHVEGRGEGSTIGMGANVLNMGTDTSLKDVVVETVMDAATESCIKCQTISGFKLWNVRVRFTPYTSGANIAFYFLGSASGSAYHCVAEPTGGSATGLVRGFVAEDTANVTLWGCEADDTANLDDALFIIDSTIVTSKYCTFRANPVGGNDVYTDPPSIWRHFKCHYNSDRSTIAGTQTALYDGMAQIKDMGLFLATGGQIGMVNVVNEFSTDGTLGGNSDLAVPTEKAVKTYADGLAVTDEKVKVSADDTTADYLIQKLAAGTGISITEVNPGGNEDARIACTLNGVPSGAIILWNNSDTCPGGYTRVSGADNRVLYAVAAGAGGVAGAATHSHTLSMAAIANREVGPHIIGDSFAAGWMWTDVAGTVTYQHIHPATDSQNNLSAAYKVLV